MCQVNTDKNYVSPGEKQAMVHQITGITMTTESDEATRRRPAGDSGCTRIRIFPYRKESMFLTNWSMHNFPSVPTVGQYRKIQRPLAKTQSSWSSCASSRFSKKRCNPGGYISGGRKPLQTRARSPNA